MCIFNRGPGFAFWGSLLLSPVEPFLSSMLKVLQKNFKTKKKASKVIHSKAYFKFLINYCAYILITSSLKYFWHPKNDEIETIEILYELKTWKFCIFNWNSKKIVQIVHDWGQFEIILNSKKPIWSIPKPYFLSRKGFSSSPNWENSLILATLTYLLPLMR